MKRHSLFAASLSAVLLAYAGQAAAEAESILSQVQRQQEEQSRKSTWQDVQLMMQHGNSSQRTTSF